MVRGGTPSCNRCLRARPGPVGAGKPRVGRPEEAYPIWAQTGHLTVWLCLGVLALAAAGVPDSHAGDMPVDHQGLQRDIHNGARRGDRWRADLKDAVDRAVAEAATPGERLRAAALGFFDFYAENPRDLDLGFYLFRGGMRPKGLGRERDERLNPGLAAALAPIAEAARALGADPDRADRIVADAFAHATGLLLLDHTGRIRLFRVTARDLMADHVDVLARRLIAA